MLRISSHYLSLLKAHRTAATFAGAVTLIGAVLLVMPGFMPSSKSAAGGAAAAATLGASTTPKTTPSATPTPSPSVSSTASLVGTSATVVGDIAAAHSSAQPSAPTPAPSSSPSAPNPAVETWFDQYGAFFRTVDSDFNQLSADTGTGQSAVIASDCHNLAVAAQAGLDEPVIPDATLSSDLDLDLNGIVEGGHSCADGISFNDPNEYSIGYEQLEAARQGFDELEAKLATNQ